MTIKSVCSFPLVALMALGCGQVSLQPANQAELQGARLSIDYFGSTDVVGFHYTVSAVACAGDEAVPEAFVLEANVDLLDGIMPGSVELLEQTFDPSSGHLGADLFMSLPVGCYDVEAAPASAFSGASWEPSEDCATATATDVEVTAGLTTEVTLVSQCVGDPLGALDVAVGLNHPPTLIVTIDEKFNYECEAVEVCATTFDVDDDPIEFVWENLSDRAVHSITPGPAELIAFEDGHRVWKQCASIVTSVEDSYDVSVTVYDLGWQDGDITRFEEIVAPEESHATLSFPIHTMWAEDPMCLDASGVPVPAEGVDIVRDPTCEPLTAEEYYCSGECAVDAELADFLCDGESLIVEALYPPC